ncbi:hypothetical protein ACFLUK_00425, partial [Chloroflexota bacterium]
MEVIRFLLSKLRRTGVLILIGLILIIYIALGFVYLQQAPQQSEVKQETSKLSAILARSLPNGEELKAEYEDVNQALAPMADSADYIAMLVRIARESGIDTNPDTGKFTVPPVTFSQVKMGGNTYQLISFKGIHVQGDYNDVMAFTSDLDSGEFMLDSDNITRKTMVLTRVSTSEVNTEASGE